MENSGLARLSRNCSGMKGSTWHAKQSSLAPLKTTSSAPSQGCCWRLPGSSEGFPPSCFCEALTLLLAHRLHRCTPSSTHRLRHLFAAVSCAPGPRLGSALAPSAVYAHLLPSLPFLLTSLNMSLASQRPPVRGSHAIKLNRDPQLPRQVRASRWIDAVLPLQDHHGKGFVFRGKQVVESPRTLTAL